MITNRIINYLGTFILLFMVTCVFGICQSVNAQIKEYNEELAKTPLAGVEVSVNDAGQRVSDSKGMLTLRFLTKNIGDHVDLVEISKLGYELFNKDAVAQWNISGESRPFTIVMCLSERFKKIKDNYNTISSASYAKQKRKEEERLKNEHQKGLLKEAEYKRKLQELQDEFDKQSLSVRPYIDHFARIDLSELSSQEMDIVKLVKTGQIDSAVCLYKQMHLEERFKNNRKSFFELNEATEMLEQAKKKSNEERDGIILQIWNKNNLLMMQGGKENIELVEKSYKEIANQDTTYLYGLSAYAAFLYGQHRDRENLRYLHLIAKCGEREYHHRLSDMYHGIANSYFSLDENDSAKVYLNKSIEANEKYNKNDSVEYFKNISGYYIMMAQIHNREGDLMNAEKASEKGLEYTKLIYYKDKNQYVSQLKMALSLAISFNQTKPDSCIENMNNVYNELPFSSEEDGDIELVFGTFNIVNQYLSQGKSQLAKRLLKNVINRIKPLYDRNEDKYRNLLSTYSILMGSIYYGEQDFSSAQNFLEEGCQLLKLEYWKNQNAQTLEALVMGMKMLGDIKSKYGYREIADSLYESALVGCNFMSQKEFVKSNYVKSIILYDKAMHFIQYENMDLAIKTLENKIRIDSVVQKCLPDSCSPPNDSDGRYELAKLYIKKGLYDDAKLVLAPCLEVISDQSYDVNLLYIDLLVRTKEFQEAIHAIDNFEKLLSIWRKLSHGESNVCPEELIRFEQDDEKMALLLHYKAICFYALGKEKKAKKVWNNVRELLPGEIYASSPLRNIFD